MVIINSFRQPESTVRCEQKNVRAVLDKNDLGIGTLFVSENTLCWQGPNDVGFSIGYQNISLHAIAKDINVYPQDCIYIMVDGQVTLPGQQQQQAENDSDEESEPNNSDIVLVPEEDPALVSIIYEAIKVCQELNPDPCDVDEDDDHLYEDAEDDMEGDYEIQENRGGGDADVENLSRRMQRNVDINYATNGNSNDEEDFEDAD